MTEIVIENANWFLEDGQYFVRFIYWAEVNGQKLRHTSFYECLNEEAAKVLVHALLLPLTGREDKDADDTLDPDLALIVAKAIHTNRAGARGLDEEAFDDLEPTDRFMLISDAYAAMRATINHLEDELGTAKHNVDFQRKRAELVERREAETHKHLVQYVNAGLQYLANEDPIYFEQLQTTDRKLDAEDQEHTHHRPTREQYLKTASDILDTPRPPRWLTNAKQYWWLNTEKERYSATCAVPIECEHGYDCCPICDWEEEQSEIGKLKEYLQANYPNEENTSTSKWAISALQKEDIAAGAYSAEAQGWNMRAMQLEKDNKQIIEELEQLKDQWLDLKHAFASAASSLESAYTADKLDATYYKLQAVSANSSSGVYEKCIEDIDDLIKRVK